MDIGMFTSDDLVLDVSRITWINFFLNYGPKLTIFVMSFCINTISHSSNATLPSHSAV